MNIISFVNMIAEMLIKKELEHFVPRSWVWVGVGWTNLRRHIQTPGSQRSRGTDIAMRQSCGEHWADLDENDHDTGDYNADDSGDYKDTDIGHWRLKYAEQILSTLWFLQKMTLA